MRTWNLASTKRTWLLLATVSTTAAILTGCPMAGEREDCVSRDPMLGDSEIGYEIVNGLTNEVWLTRGFTPEEFEELSLPFGWVKNQPRAGSGEGNTGVFLQSPGCHEPGQFTYLHAFDNEFLNVVKLIERNRPVDEEGLIRKTLLEKYHVLTYFAGTIVPVLESPLGERFILVSRDVNRTSDTFALPDGWYVTEYELLEDLEVDLSGMVSVLRMENEDSYQGPLPSYLDF